MAMELDAAGSLPANGVHADQDQTLVAEANSTPPATPAAGATTITIALEAGDIVHLPAGTDISHPVQNGADLEFVQPDGTVIVIPGGAVADLVLFVGDVEIPADTIAALFSANNIQPAEGNADTAPDGAHGNFTHPPGSIGDAFGLTDLLPPTELAFGSPELPDLYPQNHAPRFVDDHGLDMDVFFMAPVSEEGLLDDQGFPSIGNPDDYGANDTTNNRIQTGTFGVVDSDGDHLTFKLHKPAEELTSGGQLIHWSGVGTSLLIGTIEDGSPTGKEIIRIALADGAVNDGKGQYAITLSGPIDHPNDSRVDPNGHTEQDDEDDLSLHIKVTVTDNHGGSDTATFVLTIEDDSPELNNIQGPRGGSVDEDDISTLGLIPGDPGSLGTSPPAPNSPARLDGNLHDLVHFGGDGEKAGGGFVFATDLGALDALGLTSHGDVIHYALNGTAVEGTAAGRLVFALDLESNGHYHFRLYDQVDHDAPTVAGTADENTGLAHTDATAIDFGQVILAYDNDGDFVTLANQLPITIVDDIPKLIGQGVVSIKVDEDDIDTVNNYLHTNPSEPGSLGSAPNDGDSVDGSFTGPGGVDTHGPANATSVGLLNTIVQSGADEGLTFSVASDAAALTSLTAQNLHSHGAELSYQIVGNKIYGFVNAGGPGGHVYDAGQDHLVFTLEITDTSTGAFKFSLYDQLDHAAPPPGTLADENSLFINFGSVLQASDFDGDTIKLVDRVMVEVKDDIPTLTTHAPVTLTVDEDDIDTVNNFTPGQPGSLGSAPNDGDSIDGSLTGPGGVDTHGPANATSSSGSLLSLVVASGADESLTFGMVSDAAARAALEAQNIKSHGSVLSYQVVGDTVYGFVNAGGPGGHTYDAGEDRLVFKLEVTNTSTGEFKFSLYDQLDHAAPAPGTADQNNLQIDFGSVLQVTDFDKDSVPLTGKVLVNVTDDIPVLSSHAPVTLTVDEDDIDTVNNFTPGEPGSLGTFPNDGDSIDGSLTGPGGVNTHGPANATSQSGSLLSLVVASGADESLTFGVVSDAAARAALEAQGLKSHGSLLSYQVVGNTVYGFVNQAGPHGLTYDTPADHLVFKLEVTNTATGEFKFSLYDQLDHAAPAPGTADQNNLQIDFGSVLQVTDFDKDSVPLTGKVLVNVTDDIPVVSLGYNQNDQYLTVDETAGLQGDDASGLEAIFTSVANKGTDADMPNAQYAQDSNLFTFSSSVGADEPATKVFTLGVVAADSGLKTSDGVHREIYLFKEGDYIVGRYDVAGNAVTGDDPAAFAIYINPTSGAVSIAQFVSIEHPVTTDPDDIKSMLTGKIEAHYTVTDFDGDAVTATVDLGSHIQFRDDGPTVTVTPGQGSVASLAMHLDETVQTDGATTPSYDRYGTGENSGAPGQASGGADDVSNGSGGYNRAPVWNVDPAAASAFGHLETNGGALADLFTVTPTYGADGPATTNQLTHAYSLVLSSASVATNLVATALAGSPLAGMTAGERAISLVQVIDTVIEGRIPGTGASGDEYVAFRITLDAATDPAHVHLSVDQFLPLDHGGTENPSLLDEVLNLLTTSGSLGVTDTVTVTDGDGDSSTVTSSTVTLIDGQSTIVTFDDDGPVAPVLSFPDHTANGLFFAGFNVNNSWGVGSGIAYGTAGDWVIEPSAVGGATNPQLERVAEPYGNADSPTNSLIVDLEASPGNVQVSQTLHDLDPGRTYILSFEVGRSSESSNPDTAQLTVLWGTTPIAVIDPHTGLMQTITIHVTADSANEKLTFQETGTAGDNTGTYLANVRFLDALIIDETKGVDADSDDTEDPAIAALFSGVAHVGHDGAMGSPQFATGSHAVVNVGPQDYGRDGPALTDALHYSLALASSTGVDSGLKTTDGKEIYLFAEGGLIVGRYESTHDSHVTGADNAAFALTVDPLTGHLSVAQYVSLQHPDTSSNDEGISLAPGSLQVVVTLTDGDGDKVSSTADISSVVIFEDDGPTMTGMSSSVTVDENDLDNAGHPGVFGLFDIVEGSAGTSPDGDTEGPLGGLPGMLLGWLVNPILQGSTSASGTLAATVNFGADDPGSFVLNGSTASLEAQGLHSKGDLIEYATLTANGQSFVVGYVSNIGDANVDAMFAALQDILSGHAPGSVDLSGVSNPEFRLVFTLGLDSHGAYEFRLFDQLDHAATDNPATPGINESTDIKIDFSGVIDARDADGDHITLGNGTLSVDVTDDAPQLSGNSSSITVAEDDIETAYSTGTSPDDGDQTDHSFTGDHTHTTGGPANASGSLAGLAISGADEGLTYGFVDTATAQSALNAQNLFSKGDPLSYSISGDMLTATAGTGPGARAVFTLEVDATTGKYTFSLYDQLDHDKATHDTNLPIDFGGVLQATDFDGDPVVLTGKVTVNVTDDTPIASSTGSVTGYVDEDDLNQSANPGDLSTGIATEGTSGVGDTTTTKFVFHAADLLALVGSVGADEPGHVALASSVANGTLVYASGSTNVVQSHGVDIQLGTSGGDIVGLAGGRVVFTLHQESNGDISFTLHDQIDHNNASATGVGDAKTLLLDLSGAVVIADNDGDTVPAGANSFRVSVENDIPAGSDAIVKIGVAEDYLTTGNQPGDDYSSASATLLYAALKTLVVPGADEDVHFSLAQDLVNGQVSTSGANPHSIKSGGADVLLGVNAAGEVVGYVNVTGGTGHYDEGTDRVVFKLTDTHDGNFTFTLLDHIDHISDSTGEGHLGDAGVLTLDLGRAFVATDYDGDPITLRAGAIQVTVENDVPTLSLNGATTLQVDETMLGTDDSVSAAAFFSVNYGADGEAAGGGLSGFHLGVTPAAGGGAPDSGLVVTSSGLSVFLFLEGGNVVGRAGTDATAAASGPVAFKLTLSGGTLELDQVLALVHGDHPTNYNEPVGLSAANLITLTATATDYDNDSVTKTVDIGDKLSFLDDGPDAAVADATVAPIVLDESPIGTDPGGDNTPAGLASKVAHLAGNFAIPSYGADGAGPSGTSYALQLSGGDVPSGLYAHGVGTARGAEIVLNLVGNVITGSAGGTPYFTITVDPANGDVTFTQLQSIWHESTGSLDDTATLTLAHAADLTLVQTVVDGDLDSDSASINLGTGVFQIEDDGPSFAFGTISSAGLASELDETVGTDRYNTGESETGSNANTDDAGPGLAQVTTSIAGGLAALFPTSVVSYGADGQGAANVATLSFTGIGSTGIATNLSATNGGPIVLFLEGGKLVGHDTDSSGTTVFTIEIVQVAGVSQLQTTLFHAIAHGDTALFDENAILKLVGDDNPSIGLNYSLTVTDGDGDTVTHDATLPLINTDTSFFSFDDDGPQAHGYVADSSQLGNELIVNGGFENISGTTPELAANGWQVYQNIDGWQAQGGIPLEVQSNGAGGIATHDGGSNHNVVELDSDFDGNSGTDENATNHTNVTIAQTITTVIGQTYELSFWYAPRPDHADSSGMDVRFDGQTVFSLVADASNPYGWTHYTAVVTATSTSSTLSFTGTGAEDEFGMLLDDVSLKTSTVWLDDEAQNNGIDGGPGDQTGANASSASGTLLFDAGSDGLKSLSFDDHAFSVTDSKGVTHATLTILYVDGEGLATPENVTLHWDATSHTLYGTSAHYGDLAHAAFTLSVNQTTGQYVFQANAPLAHPFTDAALSQPPAAGSSWEDELTLNFTYKVTDGDNDTATGNLSITIDDDSPKFGSIQSLDMADVVGVSSGTIDFEAGADGIGSLRLSGTAPQGLAVHGSPVHYWVSADGHTLIGYLGAAPTGNNVPADQAFTVTLAANGKSYTFSLQQPLDGDTSPVPALSFGVTLTDGDGDAVQGTIGVSLTDHHPTLTLPSASDPGTLVDEKGLPSGSGELADNIPGNDNSETTQGTFTYKAGDGATTVTIDGHPITQGSFSGTYGTLTIGTVSGPDSNGVVTVSYTYTLDHNAPHTNDHATGAADQLPDQFAILVTDADGDTAPGTLTIEINDDGPKASPEASQSVIEGGFIGGHLDFVAGADGAHVTKINGETLNFDSGTGWSQAVDIGAGTIRVQADGTYEFTADPSVDNSAGAVPVHATYTVKDGDGDEDSSTIDFTITDGAAPTGADTVSKTFYENDLPDGSSPSPTDLTQVATLTFHAGSDALSNFVFTGTAGLTADSDAVPATNEIVWSINASNTVITGKVDGQTAITMTLGGATSIGPNSNGAVTVTTVLSSEFHNLLGDNAATSLALGAVTVQGSDDTATVTGTVNVTVIDDVPSLTIGAAGTTVAEGDTLNTGTWHLTPGADGLASGGLTITIGNDTYDVVYGQGIPTGKGTLTISAPDGNGNGSWTFEAANDLDNSVAQSVSFTLKATDGDGDTTDSSHTITITDGTDTTVSGTASLSLQESDIRVSGSTDTDSSTGLTFHTGSDTAALTFAASQNPGVVGLETAGSLTWVLDSGDASGHTLLGKVGGTTVITVTLTGTLTAGPHGTITPTVTAVLHDNFLNEDSPNASAVTITGLVINATETDGVVATGTVNVTVTDDTPSAVSENAVATEGKTLQISAEYGVLANDHAGADGYRPAGAIVGVATGSDTSHAVSGHVGTAIAGVNGTLTLYDDGHFDYVANSVTNGSPDVFVYTIEDADGDVSTAKLSISTANVSGGTATVVAGASNAYEDAAATTAGQRTNDASNTHLDLTFTLKVAPTDVGDSVGSATISGIPTDAVATWTDGSHSLTLVNGAVTATSGGTGTDDSRAAFLAQLKTPGGAELHVVLAEHDSRDVTIGLTAVVDGTATNTASDKTTVDAVAADPVLTDPTDKSVNESGGATTAFAVTVQANFADAGDGNEVHQMLFKVPSGFTLVSVTGNGAALADGTGTTTIPGGIVDPQSGQTYVAYNVTPDSNGNVSLILNVTGPGSVSANTSGTVDIIARSYDPVDGSDITLANNVATASQSVKLTVVDSTHPLSQIHDFTGIVEEEQLHSAAAMGIDDTTSSPAGDGNPSTIDGDDDTPGNLNVTTDVTTIHLASMVSGGDGALTYGFNVVDGSQATFVGGAAIKSEGQNVLFDVQGSTLYGYVNNGGSANAYDSTDRLVFRVDLDTSGDATFKLLDNIDHTNGDNIEGIQALDLSGKLKVTDANHASMNFDHVAVDIIDDTPLAVNSDATAIAGVKPSVNAVFVIDLSGSMAWSTTSDRAPTGGEISRLTLLRQAVTNLLQNGDVIFNEVVIYTFNSDVTYRGTYSAAGAVSYVNGTLTTLPLVNSTSYASVTNNLPGLYDDLTSHPAADKTFLYFLTDGDPTGGVNPNQTAWTNFLNNPDGNAATSDAIDQAFAVGFSGVTTTTSFLDSMAPRSEDAAIGINNPANLSTTLQGSLPGNPSGSIFDEGGGFGADGGHVLSVTYNGHEYDYDGSHAQVTITDAYGGKLIFNFVDNGLKHAGDWDYFAPSTSGAMSGTAHDLGFSYVLIDGDGDRTPGNMTIHLELPPTLSVTADAATVGEATAYAQFHIDLSHSTLNVVTLDLALSGTAGTGDHGAIRWSADNGQSWTTGTTASIPVGSTELLVRTDITHDSIVETNETLILTATPTGGIPTGTSPSATTTIIDDDTVKVAINDVTVNEGGTATFTVTLTGTIETAVSFNWATSDGASPSATAGSDYTISSGTVTFSPGGPSTATITVPVLSDSIADGGEHFNVTLTPTNLAQVDTAGSHLTGTATITDVVPNVAPTDLAFVGNDSLSAGGGNGSSDTTVSNGSRLFTVGTIDPDDTSGFSYSFSGGGQTKSVNIGGSETLTINSSTGVVTTSSLDYGGTSTTTLDIVSTDSHGASRTETVTLYLGDNGDGNSYNGSSVSNDQVIYGFGGNDNLTGGSGNDWIAGGSGADTLIGGGGNDTLDGGDGHDTLTGGSGADVFVWSGAAYTDASSNTITDYNFAQGDKIELQVAPTGSGAITDYIRLVDNGTSLELRVDSNGTNSSGPGFVTIFTLTGSARTSGVDPVRFSFNGHSYTITDTNVVTSVTDPIILDLDHNGYSFSSLEHGVQFDINADGAKDQVAWNTSNDAILALDVNGNGKIDDGSEIFTPDFRGGHFASGSEALASLDTNHDGLIDEHDVDFSKLVVWNDANANGVADEGEVTSLTSHGVVSLSAPGTPADEQIDGQAVTAHGVVTFADGTTGDYIEAGLETSLGTPAPLLGVTDSSSFADGLDWDNVVIGTPDVADTLHGTDGADKFTLTDVHAVDLIADYNFEQGDSVDLSALLGEHSGATKDNAADYVKYDSTTGTISVDTDGAAGGHNFVDVAVIDQPTPDVKIILDDGVDVTVNHLG